MLGYVIRFDPREYRDRKHLTVKHGCGTAAGRELVELCVSAYTRLLPEIPGLQGLFLCGVAYGQSASALPPGIEVHEYIESLCENYAACDVTIVVGGGH